jgi:hypothetical protein
MKKSFLIAYTSLFSAIVILTSPSIAQTTSRVEVTNKTKSLEVTSVKVIGASIHAIGLKNIGSKTIIAYELVRDRNVRVINQPKPPSNMLKPNEEDSVKMLMGNGSPIQLTALYFADETSEGDPEAVERLRQYHRGTKLAMRKLLPYLEKITKEFESQKTIRLKSYEYHPQFLAPDEFTKPEAQGFDQVIRNTFIQLNLTIQNGNQQQIAKLLKDLTQSYEKYKGEKLVPTPKYVPCKERRMLQCADSDERCLNLKNTPCDEEMEYEHLARRDLFFEKVKEYHETGQTSLTEDEIEEGLIKYKYIQGKDQGKFVNNVPPACRALQNDNLNIPPEIREKCGANALWIVSLDFRVKKNEVEEFAHYLVNTYGGRLMQTGDSGKPKDHIINEPAMSWFYLKIDEEGAKRISEHPKVRIVRRVN